MRPPTPHHELPTDYNGIYIEVIFGIMENKMETTRIMGVT